MEVKPRETGEAQGVRGDDISGWQAPSVLGSASGWLISRGRLTKGKSVVPSEDIGGVLMVKGKQIVWIVALVSRSNVHREDLYSADGFWMQKINRRKRG